MQDPSVQSPASDKRRILYDALSSEYNLGTFDEFSAKLNDPGKRRVFYDAVSSTHDLGDFPAFETKISSPRPRTVADHPLSDRVFQMPEQVVEAPVSAPTAPMAPESVDLMDRVYSERVARGEIGQAASIPGSYEGPAESLYGGRPAPIGLREVPRLTAERMQETLQNQPLYQAGRVALERAPGILRTAAVSPILAAPAAAATGGNVAISGLMASTPMGLAFTYSNKALENISPEVFHAMEVGLAPLESYIAGKPVGDVQAVKDIVNLGDLAYQLLLFKGIHQGTAQLIGGKIAGGKPLTMADRNILRQGIQTFKRQQEIVRQAEQEQAIHEAMPLPRQDAGLYERIPTEGAPISEYVAKEQQGIEQRAQERIKGEKERYAREKALKGVPRSDVRGVTNLPEEPVDVQQIREELLAYGIPGEEIVRMREPELRNAWRRAAKIPVQPESIQQGQVFGASPEELARKGIKPEPSIAEPGTGQGVAPKEAEPAPTVAEVPKVEGVAISDVDVRDSHGGELFGSVYAYSPDGKRVGRVDFSRYDGRVGIQWIEVDEGYRRRGIATQLRKKLQDEFPQDKIGTFGDVVTPEGAAFERAAGVPRPEAPAEKPAPAVEASPEPVEPVREKSAKPQTSRGKLFRSEAPSAGGGSIEDAGEWEIVSDTPKTVKLKFVKRPQTIWGERYSREPGYTVTIRKDNAGPHHYHEFSDGSFTVYFFRDGTPESFKPIEKPAEAPKRVEPPAPVKQPWEMKHIEFYENDDVKITSSLVKSAAGKPAYEYTAKYGDVEISLVQKSQNINRATELLHKKFIERALSEGKPVPPEVLKDYPEFQKRELPGLPSFASTNDAMSRGKSLTPEEITGLSKRREDLLTQSKKAREEKRFDDAVQLATKAQFDREAIEVATGKFPKVEFGETAEGYWEKNSPEGYWIAERVTGKEKRYLVRDPKNRLVGAATSEQGAVELANRDVASLGAVGELKSPTAKPATKKTGGRGGRFSDADPSVYPILSSVGRGFISPDWIQDPKTGKVRVTGEFESVDPYFLDLKNKPKEIPFGTVKHGSLDVDVADRGFEDVSSFLDALDKELANYYREKKQYEYAKSLTPEEVAELIAENERLAALDSRLTIKSEEAKEYGQDRIEAQTTRLESLEAEAEPSAGVGRGVEEIDANLRELESFFEEVATPKNRFAAPSIRAGKAEPVQPTTAFKFTPGRSREAQVQERIDALHEELRLIDERAQGDIFGAESKIAGNLASRRLGLTEELQTLNTKVMPEARAMDARIEREKNAAQGEFITTEEAQGQERLFTEGGQRPSAASRPRTGWLAGYTPSLAATGGRAQSTLPVRVTDFTESDLMDVKRLRDAGKRLASNMEMEPGKDVRMGLIKRFRRRAWGLFFPDSGLIRIRNINDLQTFSHEIGHKLDHEVFRLTDQIKFNKGDQVEQILVMQLGRYKTDPMKRGRLLDNLRRKYGAPTVDSVLHRYELRQELKQMLKDDHYPNVNTEEGIAEFVRKYVSDPDQVIQKAPKFYSLFEGLVQQNPQFEKALKTARVDWKEYGRQSPIQLTASTIMPNERDSWLDGIREGAKPGNLYYEIVNVTKPFQELDRALVKAQGDVAGMERPLLQVLTTLGIEGKLKQYLENHPFLRSGNDIDIKTDQPGLLKILSRMVKEGSLRSHESYFVAKRNIELIANNKAAAATTSREIAEATVEAFERKYGREYAEGLSRQLSEYNDTLLQYYRDSGKISQAIYEQIRKENKFYIPFKRYFDEYESTGSISKGGALKDTSPSPVKKIRGSIREVSSPIENMVQNTYELILAADKNIALRTIVQALQKIDPHNVQSIPKRVMKPAYVTGENGIEVRWQIQTEKPKNAEIVSIWNRGEIGFYQIPKQYFDAFFGLYEPYAKAIRLFSLPVQLLRAGAVVYDPTFGFRNIARDQISGLFYSKYGYNPYHFAKGVFAAINKEQSYQKFLASGADISFLADTDRIIQGQLREGGAKGHLETLKRRYFAWNGLFRLAQDFGRGTELGTRVGAFRNAYLKTGDVFKAMQEGRDIGGDYSVKGAAMRNISPLYAFLNARTRHAENTVRTFGRERIGHTLTVGMTSVLPLVVLNWLANNSNEERRRLYNALPPWRKNLTFNVPIPGTESFWPIPKGFYGVLFGTTIEGALDWAVKNDPDVIKDLTSSLFQEFSPLASPLQIIPSSVQPVAEQLANKSAFTGRPHVPGHLQDLPPELQYDESTPEILRVIGENAGVAPKRIEAFITAYTAGTGKNILNISDEILELVGVVPKNPEDTFTRLSRMPALKAFISAPPVGMRTEYGEKFYEKLDELERVNAAVNTLIRGDKTEELNAFLEKHDADYRYYVQNQKEINKFKDAVRAVRDWKEDIMRSADPDKRERAMGLDREVTRVAQAFGESYEKKQLFSIGPVLFGALTRLKAKERVGDVRIDLQKMKGMTPAKTGTE